MPIPALDLIDIPAINNNGVNNISSIAIGGNDASPIYYLAGSMSDTSTLAPAAPLGGNDGFITALNGQGAVLWSTRLGDTGDDEAYTVIRGKYGNLWVAGLSALPNQNPATTTAPLSLAAGATQTATSTTATATASLSAASSSTSNSTTAIAGSTNFGAGILNPDSVTVTPQNQISHTTDLNRLSLWKVSGSGVVEGVSYFQADHPLIPENITDNSTIVQSSLTLTGERITGTKTSKFSINFTSPSASPSGSFSQPVISKVKPLTAQSIDSGSALNERSIVQLDNGTNRIDINNSTSNLVGFSTFKPKKPVATLVIRAIKTNKITVANYSSGSFQSIATLGKKTVVALINKGNEFKLWLINSN
jgi:hypothetical protein